ncbi:hypothetical protein Vafri_864 [Volvox africanus]|nr:hypothetical protein Vafri_864 [Volvox africanus]
MTFPSLVWMLTECGHVTPLPPGAAGADALQTGPMYELVLRAQPSIKLLYTHSPSSNVNAKASTLAGHTVNGDACLVFTPNPASFASPAVLLESLFHLTSSNSSSSASKQHPPSLPCAWSAGSRGRSVPYFQQEPSLALRAVAAQNNSGNSAAAPLQQALSPSSPEQQLNSPDLFKEKSIACAQQRQRRQYLHACPQQRQLAMRAILGSRNATTAMTNTTAPVPDTIATVTTAPPPCAAAVMCSGPAPTAIGVSPLAIRLQGITAGLPAAVEAAGLAHLSRRPSDEVGQPPCKSARSSGEFHQRRRISGSGPDPRVAVRGAESLFACGEHLQSVLESQSRALFLASMADEQQERQLLQRQPGVPTLSPRLAESSVAVSRKLAGGEGEPAQCAADQKGNTQERVRAGYGVPEVAFCEPGAAAEPAGVVMEATADVPWGEMASDTIICVAMHLPQLASQVQAMAAVCRGWRAALLSHSPLLRRVAFSLDLSRPLREVGRPSSPAAAAAAHSGAGSEMSSERCAAGMPQPNALTGVLEVPAGSVSELSSQVRDGSDLLAAAMTRQHNSGAFLLPSHGTRTQHGEEEQHHVKQGGVGKGAQELTNTVCPLAPGAAPVVTMLQRVMKLSKPWPLPGLLLAAAHASNPSAQLVLAQLLEVGWVVMRQRGGAAAPCVCVCDDLTDFRTGKWDFRGICYAWAIYRNDLGYPPRGEELPF